LETHMPTRAVIFDMDGVLVDSYQAHLESWQGLAHAHGQEFTEQQFAACFGQTSREIIRYYWSDIVDEENVAAWDAQKEELYREILRADFVEMDGAGELVRALHEAGFALAIGSSGPPANVAVVLDMLTVGDLFDVAISGMDVHRGKPDPDVFLKTAGKLGVETKAYLVIEDAPVGIKAARSAGMAVVAITGTAQRDKLAAADMVVDSLRELTVEVLAELIDANASA